VPTSQESLGPVTIQLMEKESRFVSQQRVWGRHPHKYKEKRTSCPIGDPGGPPGPKAWEKAPSLLNGPGREGGTAETKRINGATRSPCPRAADSDLQRKNNRQRPNKGGRLGRLKPTIKGSLGPRGLEAASKKKVKRDIKKERTRRSPGGENLVL